MTLQRPVGCLIANGAAKRLQPVFLLLWFLEWAPEGPHSAGAMNWLRHWR